MGPFIWAFVFIVVAAGPNARFLASPADGWSSSLAGPERRTGVRALLRKGFRASDSLAWPMDHHDQQNSGYTPATGPADSSGSCRASFFKYSGTCGRDGCGDAPRYFSTGVGSTPVGEGSDIATTVNYLFFGGTDNVLRVVSGSARIAADVNTWLCNVTALSPQKGADAVSALGIVASPASWNVAVYGDLLAVASGDGYLYVLNIAQCLIDTTVCVDGGGAVVGGARTPELDAGLPCLKAAFNLPGARVGFSPPRYLSPAASSTTGGLLLTVASDPLLDSLGVLVAYPADAMGSGVAPVWTFDPSLAPLFVVATGMRGIVPAVDPVRPGLLYLPAGPGIVVLRASTGAIVNSFYPTGPSAIDRLVSSPTLSKDGSALYVHGVTGTVYRLNLITAGTSVNITAGWACDYTQEAWETKTNPCVVGGPDGTFPPAPPRPWAVRHAASGRKTGALVLRQRTDFVGGGAVRASSAEEVAALHVRIERAAAAGGLAAHAGEEKGQTAAEIVSALARSLPLAVLASLGLASGSGEGAFPSVGEFPYATPSLFPGDTALVIPQYVNENDGDTGLFTVNAGDGQPLWAFFGQTFTVGSINITLPMGRSRSSPAIDSLSQVYVGADVDWPFAEDPQPNDTMPTLFAFRPATGTGQLSIAWSWNMGSDADVPLGSASPVVRTGIFNENEVLMTAFDGAVSITEGSACGSNDPELECSGHGLCDCSTGACACTTGWTGKSCSDAVVAPAADGNAGTTTPLVIGLSVGVPLATLAVLGYAALLFVRGRSGSGGLSSALLPKSVQYSPLKKTGAEAATASYGSASSAPSLASQ